MALAHDKDGFLVGQAANIDTASYGRHLALLRQIRDDGVSVREDMAAIRKSLSTPTRKAPEIATPSQRSSNPNQGAAKPARDVVQPGAQVVTPRRPDGKFGSPDKAHGGQHSEKEARENRESTRKLAETAANIGRGAREAMSGASQMDPSLAAAKEAKDIASPAAGLLKPLTRLFRRKPGDSDAEKAASKSIPWYRRMWFELRDINKKSGSKGGGLFSGILSALAALIGLISKLTGLGALAKLLRSIPGLPGRDKKPSRTRNPDRNRPSNRPGQNGPDGSRSGRPGRPSNGRPPKPPGKLGKFGDLLGGLFKGGGGALKSLMKKIPFLGTLLSGGMLLSSIFGEDDPNKTAEENRKDRFADGGGAIGSIIGGAIGMLGGPLGVIVGGIIGDFVGTKIGEWMSTVDWAAVGQTITDTWDATAEWTMKAFDGAVGFIKDSWGSVTEFVSKVFTSISDWFGDKLGIAKDVFNGAAETVKGAAGAVVEKAKDLGNAAYDKVSQVASSAVNAAKNVASTVTGGLYKGGSNSNKKALVAEMDAQGITDPKERAMFMAQMDHESGGFKSYEENLNYSAKGLRKTFGKYYKTDAEAERDARNPEAIANRVYGGRMGNTDPGDGFKYRGRGAIGLTGKDNYARAGKALGLDLVGDPDLAKDPAIAAKIATWYWKDRNLGEAARAGDVTAATKKINGGTNGLADRQAKYNQYLSQTGDQTKAVPPPAVAQAISTATLPPRQQATATPVSVMARPVTYSQPAPDLTRYAPKEAPTTPTQIGSNQKKGNDPVRVETPLSQNVADRSIAAVAAGGIGMMPLRQ